MDRAHAEEDLMRQTTYKSVRLSRNTNYSPISSIKDIGTINITEASMRKHLLFGAMLASLSLGAAAQTPAPPTAAPSSAPAPAGAKKEVLVCGAQVFFLDTVAKGVFSDGSYHNLHLSCHHPVPKGGTIQQLYSQGWVLKETVSLIGAQASRSDERVIFIFER
jgi:hypothetical protein